MDRSSYYIITPNLYYAPSHYYLRVVRIDMRNIINIRRLFTYRKR